MTWSNRSPHPGGSSRNDPLGYGVSARRVAPRERGAGLTTTEAVQVVDATLPQLLAERAGYSIAGIRTMRARKDAFRRTRIVSFFGSASQP